MCKFISVHCLPLEGHQKFELNGQAHFSIDKSKLCFTLFLHQFYTTQMYI